MTLHTPPLSAEEVARLARLGYATDRERAGTCILVDQGVRHISVQDNQVEILPIAEALRRHDWVQGLMFSLIAPDHDEHVRQASESTDPPLGHFVRVMEGAKLRLPVQLFDMIETPQQRQFFHNITVVEKGAEVEFVTGSSVSPNVRAGHHISISESFLREGATCRSVSVEQWGPEMQVHSYARSRIDKGAHSVATSIMMSPLRHHYSHSLTEIAEDGSSGDQAIVFAPEGTTRIMESGIRLAGRGATSETTTRMVAAGGHITNRNLLVGAAPGTRGFLGCDGLKLGAAGEIVSVPGLRAESAESQLSHEASIGMISAEKMAYLMATGLTEDAARDLILQGFLRLEESNVPEAMRAEVNAMIAAAKSGSM
ncbi:SufD family Fe-S cluster assembly protein [Pseudogemmobacter sonorensis]|uniref:SufD family Fe-S cluster assembly protein n=1 Tax=Pseudogemmobacter sonorensis TaxID=2989681 RepID=UPI0036B186BA